MLFEIQYAWLCRIIDTERSNFSDDSPVNGNCFRPAVSVSMPEWKHFLR